MAMSIIPVGVHFANQASSAPQIARPPEPAGTASGIHDGAPFASLFQNALSHVNETSAISRQDSIALALGEIDDIAAMNVNSARAGLAFDLLVQLRNRVLEAYQEMMRMTV